LPSHRGQLWWRGKATKITIAAIVPVAILLLGLWRFGPGSEYIIGGKDPGVYVNEGFAIARTGALFRQDATVAAVPPAARDLFFPAEGNEDYYGHRFMGVYINDPATGALITQFPQLFPASVAIGSELAGTVGGARTVVVWALLGLLAVYFFGARLIGRLASFFAVLLLALNLVEVWFGRYPNAEMLMQTLLFGGLLALARSHQDDDPFFGWVAGLLLGLLIFLRFDSFMAVTAMAAALAMAWAVRGQRIRLSTAVPVVVAAIAGLAYYAGPLRAYFFVYKVNLPSLGAGIAAVVAGLALTLLVRRLRPKFGDLLAKYLPLALGIALVLLAAYALFLRQPAGKLAEYDAAALRTFREAYVYWPALIAALAGCVMVTRREFWRDPGFFPRVHGLLYLLLLQDSRGPTGAVDGPPVRPDGVAGNVPAGIRGALRTVHARAPPDDASRHRRRHRFVVLSDGNTWPPPGPLPRMWSIEGRSRISISSPDASRRAI
jgi:hypothetical protein